MHRCSSPVTYFNLGLGNIQSSYVHTALHETIHLAAADGRSYSDRALAQAVINLGGLSQELVDEFDKIDANDVSANSAFLDKLLTRHCE